MNKQNVLNRLSDVLNVDSINSSQADFLSTHVPFRKITVTNDLSGTPISEHISEEEIFNKYFADSSKNDQHELIVVDGSSGSGKSHFIRWIEAKLSAEETKNDVVLMIRRSDNTLKGTIKQFLNIEEVKNIIESLKKEHKKARHIPYAYKIDQIIKKSDDKEPSGTSGMPILNIIEKNNLNHVLIAVVRYFGGIKLGAGGLIRAYGNAAKEGIKVN